MTRISNAACHGRELVPASRREMLQRSVQGFGWLAASSLLAQDQATGLAGAMQQLPHSPTANNVVFLFMAGGPSHVDTYDPKPELTRLDGQTTPESIQKHFQASAVQGNGTRRLMASPFRFRQFGESGQWGSTLVEQTARHIDDLCIVRSLQHDTVIHVPGEYVMTTGTIGGDRPSLGAWVNYGLGSENQNLPGFVVLGGGPRPTCASGFLPSRTQGTMIQNAADGIPNLNMPHGVSVEDREDQLDLIGRLNSRHLHRIASPDTELEARIRSYELAFRMQMAAPEAFDFVQETEATRRLYGLDHDQTRKVGTQCLLTRRLIERGVRFIQLRVDGWDSHDDLIGGHSAAAGKSDKPIAGLISDLRQRGLLDSTLLVWGGEFGRTPGVEKKGGRDHSPGGFTMWLAGGGIRGGQTIGATDEVGYTAIDRVVTPADFHATILHALGINQHDLHFEHRGRKEIPTFNGGDVLQEAFA
jgi:hypothetical protein